MKRFIQGEDRTQGTLLPELLDDYVCAENPVRVVDVFVDHLDLGALGFTGVEPDITGRPSYHPSVLLKIYIYGYLNRIQSSRRLEVEAQRNVELMWLSSRLTPDFKTIARFRANNGKAIQAACRQFIVLCRELDLFANAVIAIDGSKFKAVNSRDKNFTVGKMASAMKRIEDSIAQYMKDLDAADREEPAVAQVTVKQINDKIDTLKEKMQRLNELNNQMNAAPDKQISLTDPDARSMVSGGGRNGVVGYNVQTAVDTKHHLIVAHEVTNVGHDSSHLYNMAVQAREAIGVEDLTVLADRGYTKGEEILACHEAGIEALVPKTHTSGNKAQGLFDKADFKYVAEKDEYRCPAGQPLIMRFISIEQGRTMTTYWSSQCQSCPLKVKCTTGEHRRVKRWEHEDVLELMQAKLAEMPDAMLVRKSTVEHPFGTIKAWMGATHFLTRSKNHVSTEMSLHVLAYNLKRVMKIMGITPLMEAMRA
jgi:transposase